MPTFFSQKTQQDTTMKRFSAAAVIAFASFSAQASIIVNGDFQTGNFTGWTKSGNTSLSDIVANSITSNHTSVWRSGATGSLAYISQNVVTVTGATYSFGFDVHNIATSNSIFEAYFDNVLVAGFTNVQHNWTHFQFDNLIASSDLTMIKFGARNDPNFTRLDNVNMDLVQLPAEVPEPGSIAMLLAGLGLLAASRRRQA
jgi:hypothetical protein